MKKLIILILCLCSYMGLSAETAIDSIQWKNNVKLAIVKQLMHGSLDNTKEDYQPILDKIDEADNIPQIKKLLEQEQLNKNVVLCGAVDGFKICSLTENKINNLKIETYIDTIFHSLEYGKIASKQTLNNARRGVINDVTQVLKNPPTKQIDRKTTKTNAKKPRASFNWGVAFNIGESLCLFLAIGCCVYLWIQQKKLKEETQTLQQDIEHCQKVLVERQKVMNHLRDDLLSAKSEISKLKELHVTTQNRESHEVKPTNQVNTAQRVQEERLLYASMPKDGRFATTTDSYKPGKTLYRIIDHRQGVGEFEFVCQPDAISTAQNSKTTFLEPACDIENDTDVYSNITMVKKGKVRYENEQWVIIEKAVICLS